MTVSVRMSFFSSEWNLLSCERDTIHSSLGGGVCMVRWDEIKFRKVIKWNFNWEYFVQLLFSRSRINFHATAFEYNATAFDFKQTNTEHIILETELFCMSYVWRSITYRSLVVVGSFGVFRWIFSVQGFHNNRCEWTDALVVRPGLRVCFALMAPSHRQTNSLEMCFFNWRALVLTSGWTHSLDFHLFFFFFFLLLHWLGLFHGICPTLHEMPGALRYVLKSSQAVQWKFDWFVVPLLCSELHFLSVRDYKTRLCHLFALTQFLDNTEIRKIGNMCPS